MAAILKFRRDGVVPSLSKAEPFWNETNTTLNIGLNDGIDWLYITLANMATTIQPTYVNQGDFLISGDFNGQNLVLAGDSTIYGNLFVGGTLTLGNGDDVIEVGAPFSGSIIPTTGSAFDLGSISHTWKNVYADSASFGYLDTTSLSLDFDNLTNVPPLVSSSAQINHGDIIENNSNQHIDHGSLNLTAGSGLSGGGILTGPRTITLSTGSSHFYYGVTDILDLLNIAPGSTAYTDQDTLAYINSQYVISGSSQLNNTTIVNLTLTNPDITGGTIEGTSLNNVIAGGNFNGVFVGDGSGLGGLSYYTDADNQEYLDTLFLISGSHQIDHNLTINYSSSRHFLQEEIIITESQISDLTHFTISDLPSGTVSGSTQIYFGEIQEKPTLVSGSSQITIGDTIGQLSGSRIIGDIQATSVEYVNVLNKPTLISGSSQLDGTIIDNLTLTNVEATGSFSGSFYGDGSNLTGVSNYSDADTLDFINSQNVASGSFLPLTAESTYPLTGAIYGGKFIELPTKNQASYLWEDKLIHITGRWQTGAFVTTNSYGFGQYSVEESIGHYVVGIGAWSLRYNTGDRVVGIGSFSGQDNIGTDNVFIGYTAGQQNLGDFANGMGYAALSYNSGSSVSAIGYSALSYNKGNNSNGIGDHVMSYNRGDAVNAFGTAASRYNAGDNTTSLGSYSAELNSGTNSLAFGRNSLRYNDGTNNIAIGDNAWNTPTPDVGNIKTVTSITPGFYSTVTIPTHGFFNYVHLKCESTDTLPSGLYAGAWHLYEVIDVNTLKPLSVIIGSTGTGTITMTPQLLITNSVAIGANSIPVDSNQIMLGNYNLRSVRVGYEFYEPSHDLDLANKSYVDSRISGGGSGNFDPTVDDSVTMPEDHGGILAGTSAGELKGSTYDELFSDIFFPTIDAYIQQSKSVSINGLAASNQEIGTNIKPSLTVTFNQGNIYNGNGTDGPALVGSATQYNYRLPDGSSETVNASNTHTYTTDYIVPLGNNSWSVIVTHDAGTGDYYDNKGAVGTNLYGSRVANTITQFTSIISGRYYVWSGYGDENSEPTDSAGVRGLSSKRFLSTSNTITFNIIIPAYTQSVYFFTPAGRTIQITYQESNADVTTTFTETHFNVNDANGTAVSYDSWVTFIGNTGYPDVATYTVTIT